MKQDWLQEGSLCDLQLCCKNGRLAAHTAVLAAHSWLFRSWSSAGGDRDLEVILPDSNIKQVRNGRTSDFCGSLLPSWFRITIKYYPPKIF